MRFSSYIEWSTILLPTKVQLILKVLRYIDTVRFIDALLKGIQMNHCLFCNFA